MSGWARPTAQHGQTRFRLTGSSLGLDEAPILTGSSHAHVA